jgi:penicillin amidase
VKGAAADTARLEFSHHEPVLARDAARHKAWVLRSTAFEPGTAPYLGALRYAQATSWEEFRAASTHVFAPAENMVWADTGGTIGWQVVGKAPRRPRHDGLVPVPGDGRFEWDGFLPVPELPHAVNPATGYVHTANEMNVPDGYAHLEAVGTQWADAYRAERIRDVLDTTTRATVPAMGALQYDAGSKPAEALVPLLRRLPGRPGSTLAAARDSLLAWDRVLAPGSVAAGIYQMWQRELRRAVSRVAMPERVRADAPPVPLSTVVRWLTAERSARDAMPQRVVLLATLQAAVDTLTARFGPDVSRWRYGQAGFHHVALEHPLAPVLAASQRAEWNFPALPMGGSGSTPWATGDGDRQVAGASFRIVIDLADLDASVATNTPGQSGDPRSPHYRDLYRDWAEGRYFPLAWSPAAVARVAESVVVLQP